MWFRQGVYFYLFLSFIFLMSDKRRRDELLCILLELGKTNVHVMGPQIIPNRIFCKT